MVEDFIIALPGIRAQSMLREAESLAAKSNRTAEENSRLQGLIASAQNEIQLAEALGYGTKDNYKPLYQQISEIRKQTEAGQSGKSVFREASGFAQAFQVSRVTTPKRRVHAIHFYLSPSSEIIFLASAMLLDAGRYNAFCGCPASGAVRAGSARSISLAHRSTCIPIPCWPK